MGMYDEREEAKLYIKSNRFLKNLLEWAVTYIDDTLEFDTMENPIHECDFVINPENGYCDFCENYWDLKGSVGYFDNKGDDFEDS